MTEPQQTVKQHEQEELSRLRILKKKLQTLGIAENDSPQQMFEKLFNVDNPLQMTILNTRNDITHLLCLGAVDQLTRPAFYHKNKDGDQELITDTFSLPEFLYMNKIMAQRSLKGAFPAIFKEIFIQNPPQEIVSGPQPLPTAIPQSPNRSWSDKITGRNKE